MRTRVNEKLKNLNIKQADLARELNISRQALSAFLMGDFYSLDIEIKLLDWLDK